MLLFLALLNGSPAAAADIAQILGDPQLLGGVCGPLAGRNAPEAAGLEMCFTAEPRECLHRVSMTGIFPEATCADGSEAVFYIRPGRGLNTHKWVIFLQGGGKCTDEASCTARWCGTQAIYHAGKMSTDWDGDGALDVPRKARANGIFADDPGNEFADWTQVFAYYCSSDQWLGQVDDVPMSGNGNTYTVNAMGHENVRYMRAYLTQPPLIGTSWAPNILANDPSCAPGQTNESGSHCLPDLDDAEEILFAGTSGGAMGAAQNADWFLAPFTEARTGLVLDGNFSATDQVLDDRGIEDVVSGLPASSAVQDYFDSLWAPGGNLEQIDAFVDADCPSGEACSVLSRLLVPQAGGAPLQRAHVTTDTFVRMDLEDSVIQKFFTEHPNPIGLDFEDSAGNPTGIEDFRGVMRDSMTEVYNGPGPGPLIPVSGLFGPACRQHVGLHDDKAFFLDNTPHYGSPALGAATFHDALWVWWNSGGADVVPAKRIDAEETGFQQSDCY